MKSGKILNSNIESESFGAKVTKWEQQKNAVKLKEYIKSQLKKYELGEQLKFSSTDPFMGGK